MVRKPIGSGRNDGGSVKKDLSIGVSGVDGQRRIDRLAEVVDRCVEAQRLAEALNEKLLAYLLAMAIQETRTAMRQEVAAAAKSGGTAPRQTGRTRRPPSAG